MSMPTEYESNSDYESDCASSDDERRSTVLSTGGQISDDEYEGAEPIRASVPSELKLESHLKMEDFNNDGGPFVQDYYVEIKGSMVEFSKIDGLAEWRPQAGNEYIFQRVSSVVDGVPVREGNLRKGALLDASWKWYHNTHDLDVGLEITGVLGNVQTRTGKAYSVIAPANQFYKDGEKCFRPAHIVSRNMLENHDLCNIDALDNDIKAEAGQPWSYVKASSVIVSLLKANKKYFGIEMVFPSSSDGFLKVNNKVIDVCRKYLEEQQDIPFIDYNKFAVKAHRVDGLAWDSPEGVIGDLTGHDEADKAYFETARMHSTKKICGVLTLTTVLMK